MRLNMPLFLMTSNNVFKKIFLVILFAGYSFMCYCMDTLFIYFDREHANQKVYELVHYCQPISGEKKSPCYKLVSYRLENNRKFIGNRIIDTIIFGHFVILDKALFNKGEKQKTLLEIQSLEEECKKIKDKNSDEVREILTKIAMANLLYEPPDPVEMPGGNQSNFDNSENAVFLSDIITDEDFLSFEEKIKGKFLYLIDLPSDNSGKLLANKVFYTKMSPYSAKQCCSDCLLNTQRILVLNIHRRRSALVHYFSLYADHFIL
jgi:hypothetical protein